MKMTMEEMEILFVEKGKRLMEANTRAVKAELELEQARKAFAQERSILENRIAQLRSDYEELLETMKSVSAQRIPLPEADGEVTTEDQMKVIRRWVHRPAPNTVEVTACGFSTRGLTLGLEDHVSCPACLEGRR